MVAEFLWVFTLLSVSFGRTCLFSPSPHKGPLVSLKRLVWFELPYAAESQRLTILEMVGGWRELFSSPFFMHLFIEFTWGRISLCDLPDKIAQGLCGLVKFLRFRGWAPSGSVVQIAILGGRVLWGCSV